jgi:hypothetical protein
MRRKQLSPDRTHFIQVFLKKDATGQYGPKPVRTTQYVNGAAVPSLGNAWYAGLVAEWGGAKWGAVGSPGPIGAKLFPNGLSPTELLYLQFVLVHYVHERLIVTNPITWNALLCELRTLSTCSKSLLNELKKREVWDSTWKRVVKELPSGSLVLTDCRSLLSSLSSAAAAALAGTRPNAILAEI